ncbi:hypothetical protein Leryth_025360 [Lithospermum erythrorhizon]|nr:hypothetical protein Leryth_025360 [Lithospermum erythrorhizon]
MVLHCEQGSLTLQYVAIPFGVHCRIDVRIPNRKGNEIVNVNGKIVARYADTYGNCSSQECVLFKKQDTEFQRVDLGYVKLFPLSRCWVSSPAYSSLIIEVDLSEFGSGRKIGNGTIKLLPQQGLMSGGSLLLDDMDIKVGVAWFSPQPLGRNDYKRKTSLPQITTKMVEEMETKQVFPPKRLA